MTNYDHCSELVSKLLLLYQLSHVIIKTCQILRGIVTTCFFTGVEKFDFEIELFKLKISEKLNQEVSGARMRIEMKMIKEISKYSIKTKLKK